MGDIPNRALFRGPVLKKFLQTYFKIVQGMSNNYSFLEAFQNKKVAMVQTVLLSVLLIDAWLFW